MLIKALNKKHVVEANAESINYKIRTRCLVQSPKTTTQVTLTATFKDLIYASLFEISSEISSVKMLLERAKQNEYEISIFGGRYENHYEDEIKDLKIQLEKLEIKLEKRKKAGLSVLRTTHCLEISVEVKEINQSEVYTTEIASDKELSKLETKSLSFLYDDKNSLKNNVLDNLYELSIKESMKITREKNFVSF